MCVKIVAECREYVFLETVAIEDTHDDETRPKTRKRLKKWTDLREAKVGEPCIFYIYTPKRYTHEQKDNQTCRLLSVLFHT